MNQQQIIEQLVRTQERLAYLEQHVEALDEVIREQAQLITRQQKQLHDLHENQQKSNSDQPTLEEERPPHW